MPYSTGSGKTLVTVEDIPGAAFGYDDIQVVHDGKVIRTFNSLSDDYALTNSRVFAREYSERLARELHEA